MAADTYRYAFDVETKASEKATGPVWVAKGTARGLALFFGAFSLINSGVAAVSGRSEDVWWIDYSAAPSFLGALTGLVAAVLLLALAFAPEMSGARRFLTAAATVTLATVAVSNTLAFYVAWAEGAIRPEVPVPFSAMLAGSFAWLTYILWRNPSLEGGKRSSLIAALSAGVLVAVFPLFQVGFFGTTDYRRPADVAVVFGAKVHADKTLSTSLADRVRTGVELYEDGLVARIVMSGGVGTNGVDEASAMRDFAVTLGVPSEDILLDSQGVNTDATVRNTCEEIGSSERVLVVSQFYHLPRIKLAYRAAGCDVLTVPAEESRPIVKTPLFVLREVPGFWVYWGRAALRGVGL